jgi:hypothetical protein
VIDEEKLSDLERMKQLEVRRTDRRRCLFIEKNKEGIRSRAQETPGKDPKTVNGETVASQWLRAELQS